MTMMSMNMPPWLAGTTTYQAIWLAPGGGQERAETASTQAMAASLHDNIAMVMKLHGGNADRDDHGGDDEPEYAAGDDKDGNDMDETADGKR